MANRYWDGSSGLAPSGILNWSDTQGGSVPASSVPGVNDYAYFTESGNRSCTLTDNWTLGNLTTEIGYTGTIDLDTFNLTMSSGGNIVLNHSGEFDCGSSTISLHSGNFDNKDVLTFTRGTSTIECGGTGIITSASANPLYNLTILENAVITCDDAINVANNIVVSGTLSVNTAKSFAATSLSTTIIGAAGKLTGDGNYIFQSCSAGKGLTSFAAGGVLDIANILIYRPSVDAVFDNGTYDSAVQIYSGRNNIGDILTLNGDYVFEGNVSLEGGLILANDTNSPNLEFKGNVSWDETFGPITYRKGNGNIILSGTSDQDIDFGGSATEEIEVNKSAGKVLIGTAFTCDSFLGTDGDFDLNGLVITSLGTVTINGVNGFRFHNGVDNSMADGATHGQFTCGDTLTLLGADGSQLVIEDLDFDYDLPVTSLATYCSVQDSLGPAGVGGTGGNIPANIDTNIELGGINTGWDFSHLDVDIYNISLGLIGATTGDVNNLKAVVFISPLSTKSRDIVNTAITANDLGAKYQDRFDDRKTYRRNRVP